MSRCNQGSTTVNDQQPSRDADSLWGVQEQWHTAAGKEIPSVQQHALLGDVTDEGKQTCDATGPAWGAVGADLPAGTVGSSR